MKKVIRVEFEGGMWKVTNLDGEWAKVPTEREAILTAQFTAKDYPSDKRPDIVVKSTDGKEKKL